MKTIGITMGDPLGVGSEVILKALPAFRGQVAFRVFGDPQLLSELPPEELVAIPRHEASAAFSPRTAGFAAMAYLDRSMLAYRAGEIQALVTAPISKEHVHLAGFPYPGHTEYLAEKTDTKRFLMMMAGPRLRVTLVTIHEPLQKVPSLLTQERILDCIELTWWGLKEKFNISEPRVAVCALNPHAGEGGMLGSEEIQIIGPAIEKARRRGLPCTGPKVPDAVFHEAYEGHWDAVVCMYHDQGLIPFKMIHFRDGVNLTLGLPLIRTSPDHGTAFDIAGKGIADPSSMQAAIRLAIQLSSKEPS